VRKIIHDYLKIILPVGLFAFIKHKYRFLKRKYHSKLTEAQFKDILTKKLGLYKGAVVFIHSSINNLYLDFPISKILKILQEIVGEEGTLLFACYPSNQRAEDYLKTNPVFDVRRTATDMGLLPEYVRRLKKSYRSLHPTHSIVAIGKYADELTKNHHKTIYPHGENSPFYEMIKYKALIIGLGVKAEDSLTFVHTVEDVLKTDFPIKTKNDKIHECEVIDKRNNKLIVKTLTPHIRIGYRNINKYFSNHIPKNICTNVKTKGNVFFRVKSDKMFNLMNEHAKKNITIYTKKAYL